MPEGRCPSALIRLAARFPQSRGPPQTSRRALRRCSWCGKGWRACWHLVGLAARSACLATFSNGHPAPFGWTVYKQVRSGLFCVRLACVLRLGTRAEK
eukprot:1160714-Pelagomonas_calceolata.AAC.18